MVQLQVRHHHHRRHHHHVPRRFILKPMFEAVAAVCIIAVVVCIDGREIPTKKAIPPLMDPIPTLPEITHRIYMDITIGTGGGNEEEDEEQPDDESNSHQPRTGRIIIGLFGKNAPTAAENFRLLATCTNTMMMTMPSTTSSVNTQRRTTSTTTTTANTPQQQLPPPQSKNVLCFKDTIFHRIVPNFAIQGGDTTHGNGIGGRAAIRTNNNNNENNDNIDTDGTYQPYMINMTQFNRPYMVAVATPNTKLAKSQFFITTVKAQWLSSLQYTIFGMILEGRDYIHTIERIAGTYGGHPKVMVQIVDCGEVPLQPYDTEPHY